MVILARALGMAKRLHAHPLLLCPDSTAAAELLSTLVKKTGDATVENGDDARQPAAQHGQSRARGKHGAGDGAGGGAAAAGGRDDEWCQRPSLAILRAMAADAIVPGTPSCNAAHNAIARARDSLETTLIAMRLAKHARQTMASGEEAVHPAFWGKPAEGPAGRPAGVVTTMPEGPPPAKAAKRSGAEKVHAGQDRRGAATAPMSPHAAAEACRLSAAAAAARTLPEQDKRKRGKKAAPLPPVPALARAAPTGAPPPPPPAAAAAAQVAQAPTRAFPQARRGVLFFDGGARKNGSKGAVAGAGAVVLDLRGEVIAEVWEYLPGATNNVAEYQALIAGLRLAAEHNVQPLQVKGDSRLVLEQVFGTWKVKAEHLLELRNAARQWAGRLSIESHNWVQRASNARADRLANIAMNTRQSGRRVPQ
jgi:ribonuclease HI